MYGQNDNIISYLRDELRFWDAFSAASVTAASVTKGRKSELLDELAGHFNDDYVMKGAEKRARDLFSVIKILNDKYSKDLVNRLNKELGTDLKHLDYESVVAAAGKLESEVPKGSDSTLMLVTFVGLAIAFIYQEVFNANAAARASAERAARNLEAKTKQLEAQRKSDEDQKAVDEAKEDIIDENKFLTCDEMNELGYHAWHSYTKILKEYDPNGRYLTALMCSDCTHLSRFMQGVNGDFNWLVPQEANVGIRLLVWMRLEYECEIPINL